MRQSDGGLRPMLRQRLPRIHWTTVESGAIAPGTPDVNGCRLGIEFWIECKWTAGWAVTLRPEQVGWLTRRARAGGRVYVLVRRKPPRGGEDQLWLLPGAEAALLKAEGLRGSVEPLGLWSGGPARWDWAELEALLLTSPAAS